MCDKVKRQDNNKLLITQKKSCKTKQNKTNITINTPNVRNILIHTVDPQAIVRMGALISQFFFCTKSIT